MSETGNGMKTGLKFRSKKPNGKLRRGSETGCVGEKKTEHGRSASRVI